MLDALQSRLDLSCVELRNIILRMPSLLGMKESSFEARIDFFQREGETIPSIIETIIPMLFLSTFFYSIVKLACLC